MTTKQTNLATWLATTRGLMLATAIFTTALFLPALYRAYPFVDDVNPTISAGNDWLTYKENALSILRDGLSMPSVPGNYSRPGGFLYNYFVASIFALTGVNSKHVYLVQTVLLGLSVGLMTVAFKPYLTNRSSSVYFVALAGLLFLEVFCIYTFRLLSENLVIFLLALFCLLALKAFKTESILLAAGAGVAAGLCALCRPNLILLAPATAAVLFFYRKGRSHRIIMPAFLLATFCLTFALLPLRNYTVTKKPSLSAITYTNDWARPEIDLAAPVTLMKIGRALVTSVDFYGRRILFCAGLTTIFGSRIYWLRPHWIIMWAGTLVFLWRTVKRRRLEFWEAFAITSIVMYLGPLLAVAQINNYGVRMIVPVLPMLLLLAIVGMAPKLETRLRQADDLIMELIKKRRSFRVEREFGFIVGGIVTLLSAWWIYRGKFASVSHITLPVGAVLVLLGLIFPKALVLPNKAWMALAEVLAFISTRIILAFVFFVIVTPIGFVKRLSGWDPLHRRAAAAESYWRPYSERQRSTRHYEKMF